MRFLPIAASLAFLIIANAYPVSNLKDELRQAAEAVELSNTRDILKLSLTIAKTIVDDKLTNQEKHQEWLTFLQHWSAKEDTVLVDRTQYHEWSTQFQKLERESTSEDSEIQGLTQYRNGVFSEMLNKIFKDTSDRLAAFQVRATEIIRVAKEAGYTDDTLDAKFERFAKAYPERRLYCFYILMDLLKKN